jgi:hypothetical protein
MGVGKSMKTFISAMTEQTGMGGYGGKIKSTPMGPFRWNDLTQLWENVNNGMVMNNVSFQDMFMMGYETNSGDNGGVVINYTPTLSPVSFGSLESMDTATTYYNGTSAATTSKLSGITVTFSNLGGPINISLSVSVTSGSAFGTLKYSKNNGVNTNYTVPISMTNGDTLLLAYTIGGIGAFDGNVIITNDTTGLQIASVPISANLE